MIAHFDCDEVLCKFMEPAVKMAERLSGESYPLDKFKSPLLDDNLPPEVMQMLDKEFEQPGWVESLEPYPEAWGCIVRLRSLGVQIFCVTSPMSHCPTWGYERLRWLDKHFGIKKKNVIQTAAKFLVHGDLFVDDLPEHVDAWHDFNSPKGGKAFLKANMFNAKENTKVERAYNWDQIYNYAVEKLK